MSEHRATIDWQRSSADFTYMTYNRAHEWRFKAETVPASATKEYRGDENRVNPEEALVAALSSCHMLFFVSYAAAGGFVIDRYEDEAIGEMGKNESGAVAMLKVRLRPKITWVGAPPEGKRPKAIASSHLLTDWLLSSDLVLSLLHWVSQARHLGDSFSICASSCPRWAGSW